MRYTQGQIRDLLVIPVETFRVWREAIPALAKHKGHAPSFTPGDVVALSVVADLVRDFGIRVGAISGRLEELFSACHGLSWLALEPCTVLIEANSVRLIFADDPRRIVSDRSVLVVSCGPIIERLRARLTVAAPDDPQGHLRFPPTGMPTGTSR
jgi:hypothetical protein